MIAHKEGGWPKEVDFEDEDQTHRYLKKIEKDFQFVDSLLELSTTAESKVKQNIAVDIYSNYFQYEDIQTGQGEHSLDTIAVFHDPTARGKYNPRPVSCISWSPSGDDRIAVAYCSSEFLGSLGSTQEAEFTDL